MGAKLKSPTLIEAICEFRFVGSETWDWTLPGQLYERVKREFSERSQVDSMAFQLHVGAGQKVGQQVLKGPERVQLKKPDDSAMIQIGPHLLVINHLKPYSDWQTFLAMISNVFNHYRDIGGPTQLARIGLRYINELANLEEVDNLTSYISTTPHLPGILDRPLTSFVQRYELLYDSPHGVLIHQTGIQKTDQNERLMLDLDFVSKDVDHLADYPAIETWLNAAHDTVYESFVASLNPDFYERRKHGAGE